jgi:hypothetical protein
LARRSGPLDFKPERCWIPEVAIGEAIQEAKAHNVVKACRCGRNAQRAEIARNTEKRNLQGNKDFNRASEVLDFF